MSADDIAALVERIVRFLEAALVERVPERDIPESEAICASMLRVLEASGSWEGTRDEIARAAAQRFAGRPETWTVAANIAGIYLRRTPSGEAASRIELGFLPAFVRGLMERAEPSDRTTFFRALKEWKVWRAVAGVLPNLEVSAEELLVLLQSFDDFSRNNIARWEVFRLLMAWSAQRPDVARAVVDGWFRGELPFSGLDREPIRFLVEAIVGEHGTEQKIREWRDQLIKELSERGDEADRRLAAMLSCFAWPKDPRPPAETRHAHLLQHVRRLPAQLVEEGLRAMVRDAGDFPEEVIRSTKALIQIAAPSVTSSESIPQIVAAIADIAARALLAKHGSLTTVEELFPLLEHVPPGAARHNLDHFLHTLTTTAPERGWPFVARWVAVHAPELWTGELALQDIFPLLLHEIGPVMEARWTIRLLTASSADLRRVGCALLYARHEPLMWREAFDELTHNEARALVHQLAGAGLPGRSWIPALFHLAKTRPGAMDDILQILLDDATLDYPSICESALDILNDKTDEHPSTVIEDLADMRAQISARLATQSAAYLQTRRLVEITSTVPASKPWGQIEQRMFDRASEHAKEKSIFASLTQSFYVARGERMTISDDGPSIKMDRVSSSIELPFLEYIDPLGARISRYAHLQKAEEILSSMEVKRS